MLHIRKVKGRITVCYSTKKLQNGYDFPKYNHVSGWLAGQVDSRRKTLYCSSASETYKDSGFVPLSLRFRFSGIDKVQITAEVYTQQDASPCCYTPSTVSFPHSSESVLSSAVTLHPFFNRSTNLYLFYPVHTYINSVVYSYLQNLEFSLVKIVNAFRSF